jgi:hypothetical protein
MSENTVPPGWVNAKLFNENFARFPAEEYLKYAGHYIAWNLDATRILASGKTPEELYDNLRALGIDPSETVESYVDPPEITGWL